MDASSIKQLTIHATSTQTTNSKQEDKIESDRPEFKVLVSEKPIIQTMCRLDNLTTDAAFLKWFWDLFLKKDERDQAQVICHVIEWNFIL